MVNNLKEDAYSAVFVTIVNEITFLLTQMGKSFNTM